MVDKIDVFLAISIIAFLVLGVIKAVEIVIGWFA